MKLKKLISYVLSAAVAASTIAGYGSYVGPVHAAVSRSTVGMEFSDTVKNAGIDGSGVCNVTFTYRFTKVGSGEAEVSLVNAENSGSGTLNGFTVQTEVSSDAVKDYGDSRGSVLSASKVKITGIDLDGNNFSSSDQIHSINLSNIAGNLTKISIQNFDYSESASKKLSLGLSGMSGKFKGLTEADFSGSHVRFDSSSQNDNIITILTGSEATLKKLDLSNIADGSDKYNSAGGVNTAIDLKKFTALTSVDLSGNAGLTSVTIAPDVVANNVYTTLNISGDTALTSLSAVAAGKDIAKYRENNPGLYQGIRFITNGGSKGSTVLDLSKYEMKSVDVEYAMLTGFVAPSGTSKNTLTLNLSHNYIRSLDLDKAKGELASLNVIENQLLDIDLSGQDTLSTLKADTNYLTSLDITPATSLTSLSLTDNYIPESGLKKSDSQKSRTLSKQKDLTTFFAIQGSGGLTSATSDAKGYVGLSSGATVYFMAAVLGAPKGFAAKLASTASWEETSATGGAVSLGKQFTLSATDTFVPEQNGYESVVVVAASVTGDEKQRGGETVTANIGGDKDTISIASDDILTLECDVTSELDSTNATKEMKNEIAVSSVFDYPQQAGRKSGDKASITIPSMDPAGKVGGYSDGLGKCLYQALSSSINATAAQAACKVGVANVGYTLTGYPYDGATKTKGATLNNLSTDTIIKAEYKQTNYSISFSGNGGSGSMDKLTELTYAQKVTIPSNSFTSSNGTFIGWVRDTAKPSETSALRLYENKASDYAIVTEGKTSSTLYAIWQGSSVNMSLAYSSLSLDPGEVVDVEDFSPVVTDSNGLAYGEADGSTKSVLTTIPKYAYFTSDDDVVRYNGQGAFYASGSGTAKIYVYEASNSQHAVGTISVTVAGGASSSDDTSADTIKVSGSTYMAFGEGYILTKAAQKTSITVNTITVNGTKKKVIGIANSAFKDNSKIKKVVIGANVQSIGQTAFLRCKNLKTVTIKSKKLTKNSSIGKNAFKSINKKATIKIAKSAYTKTKKVLKKKGGLAKTITYKKL